MNKSFTYTLFLTLGAWITTFVLLASPSDPKNAVIFGYSLERILLSGGMLIVGIALLFLTLKLRRQPVQSQRLWESIFQRQRMRELLLGFSVIVFLSLWIILFLPSYRTGNFGAYTARLHPILIWLAVASGVTSFIFLYERRQESFSKILSANKNAFQIGLIAFGIIVLLALIIASTGLGIRHPEGYWYGAGVPLLSVQILLSVVLGGFIAWLEFGRRIQFSARFDALMAIGIFLLAAILWAREPSRPNFFMPDTLKNPMYPYSDSATFDGASQYALIGQGLFNGQYFDRALYSALLVYLHILVGQNVESVLTLQAILFAFFPAVVYLIGMEMHSRSLGVSLGVLIAFRGLNAIVASQWIDLAGPKMMLTDFPTAIGIALFILFIIKWLKRPERLHLAVWAGGMLGLMMMLRTHVLFLLPILVGFILLFVTKVRWNYRFVASIVLILGMLTATMPWDLRSHAKGSPLFYMYYYRILIVLKERYGIQGDTYQPASQPLTLSPQFHGRAHGLFRTHMEDDLEKGCDSFSCQIASHMMHNVFTSMAYLPSSLQFDDLWNVVKEDAPFWQANWTGEGVVFSEYALLFLDFALVSLGIGLAWQRQKWIGLLPLGIFLSYLFTNTIGLTSGGRYVAPVDWIVLIYFLLGILQVLLWGVRWAGFISNEELIREDEILEIPTLSLSQFAKIIPSLALIFMIGLLVPASENLFKPKYQVQSSEVILTNLEQNGSLERSGLSHEELTQFMKDPQAVITVGKALYPRYYRADGGEPDRSSYYRPLDYSRLVLTVIGPYSVNAQGVVIPGDKPNFDLYDSDVIVIGCQNREYYAPFIDAVVVFVTSEPNYIYTRAPASPLQCPLQTP